jgi:hypothetical protein
LNKTRKDTFLNAGLLQLILSVSTEQRLDDEHCELSMYEENFVTVSWGVVESYLYSTILALLLVK